MIFKRSLCVPVLLTLLCGEAHAASPDKFKISGIEVEGLQRISEGTVFAYLPVHAGEIFNDSESSKIIGALYHTGFFSDVSLYRQNHELIIKVKERPAINNIKFSGNKAISTDQLKLVLMQAHVAKAQIYKPAVLEQLQNALRDQYFARGKYNVKIDTVVKHLPRNRVNIDIKIVEGRTAKIKQVNIVGNHAYQEQHLRSLLDVGIPPWWAFLSDRDKYSSERLNKSLEALRSQYLNHGYIDFAINSTQVALTPSHRHIYVDINIHEGDQYHITNVKLAGNLLYPKTELNKLVHIKPGQIFSRKQVTDTIKALTELYGDHGYAFANINPIPDINREKKTIGLTFFIDPGKRVYVNQIHFFGNKSTQGEVLRREMRQLEGAQYSTKLIDRSKIRLQRLPFIESVNVETQRVPGSDDEVNLNVHVKERLAGSFVASVGYSQFEGVILSTSVSTNNFLGEGKAIQLGVNTSSINTLYQLNYRNPYYTLNGVSRSVNLYYQRTNTSQVYVVDYSADRLGATVSYGIPISEYDSLDASYGYQGLKVLPGSTPSQTVTDFVAKHGNDYNMLTLGLGYSHDSRNRTVFPTEGNLQTLKLSFVTPGSTIKYYKIGYDNQEYLPITHDLTLSMSGSLGYGAGYGGTHTLPFFDTYYTGGISSVAGYQDYSLGPQDPVSGLPIGGDVKVVGRMALIFPMPFLKNSSSVRLSTFFDAGNVFASPQTYKTSDLRTSAGIGLEWLSPIGPLSFSVAKALNARPGDHLQVFQFNIGTYF
ncbi:outer membrane protein assembly factor BamA [Acidihalobacter aeolianus]|uniref:Outer membrane protein assembly factor BamA n=1 Tax=Acidihalobacter aeolianus TaxID=2792603 RepID=A0A1D8K732_9GAMM|nr:outer membrane protein assembly factor BamA [Acidihalobacter aeolianus]AOV16730.1 outer membrane protein assembly factor BamA [Acidihalobacter aeolianus]